VRFLIRWLWMLNASTPGPRLPERIEIADHTSGTNEACHTLQTYKHCTRSERSRNLPTVVVISGNWRGVMMIVARLIRNPKLHNGNFLECIATQLARHIFVNFVVGWMTTMNPLPFQGQRGAKIHSDFTALVNESTRDGYNILDVRFFCVAVSPSRPFP
jgi:hypothetical protein